MKKRVEILLGSFFCCALSIAFGQNSEIVFGVNPEHCYFNGQKVLCGKCGAVMSWENEEITKSGYVYTFKCKNHNPNVQTTGRSSQPLAYQNVDSSPKGKPVKDLHFVFTERKKEKKEGNNIYNYEIWVENRTLSTIYFDYSMAKTKKKTNGELKEYKTGRNQIFILGPGEKRMFWNGPAQEVNTPNGEKRGWIIPEYGDASFEEKTGINPSDEAIKKTNNRNKGRTDSPIYQGVLKGFNKQEQQKKNRQINISH